MFDTDIASVPELVALCASWNVASTSNMPRTPASEAEGGASTHGFNIHPFLECHAYYPGSRFYTLEYFGPPGFPDDIGDPAKELQASAPVLVKGVKRDPVEPQVNLMVFRVRKLTAKVPHLQPRDVNHPLLYFGRLERQHPYMTHLK